MSARWWGRCRSPFERLSPSAQQLLRLCAYAAPEPLPERVFREAVPALPEALSEAAGDPLAWSDLIGELRRYGLVNRVDIPALDREPGEKTERTEQALSLHRLTQKVTRTRLANPEVDCRAFQSMLRECCPVETQLPTHWPRYAALAEHVIQLDRFYDAGWLDAAELSLATKQSGNLSAIRPGLVRRCGARIQAGAEHRHRNARRRASRHAHEHEQPRLDALGIRATSRGREHSKSRCSRCTSACSAKRIPTRS